MASELTAFYFEAVEHRWFVSFLGLVATFGGPQWLRKDWVDGVFEELLWRVGMDRLFVSRRFAVARWLFLSVIFGLSHVHGTPGGTVGMIFAGLFGFAMCLIRQFSRGSAVWVLVTHFVADLILIGGAYGIFSLSR